MIREVLGTFLAIVVVLSIWSGFRHARPEVPVRPTHTVHHVNR